LGKLRHPDQEKLPVDHRAVEIADEKTQGTGQYARVAFILKERLPACGNRAAEPADLPMARTAFPLERPASGSDGGDQRQKGHGESWSR